MNFPQKVSKMYKREVTIHILQIVAVNYADK